MRWVLLFVLLLEVHSVPSPTKRRKTQIYMTSIDLDTNRKRNVDPEVIPDIGSQLPPVKRNVSATPAPDYGDYEDYELTSRTEETTPATTERPAAVDSQFTPHLKISLKNQKTSAEVRDEVARLMGDLHREELTMRTTVTKENMITTPTMIDVLLLGNETMFFEDEEGSGVMAVDEAQNETLADSGETLNSTSTQKPLLFTTLVQEIKAIPVTARPDPFEHLDYDLNDHSNSKKPRKNIRTDRLKKYKSLKLHGGAVGKNGKTPVPTIHSVTVKGKKKKILRKINRIDKMKKVKYLNQRMRAQNRMRLRKVLSKMIFGSRDRVATSQKSTKLKFVGSNGVVTPAPFSVDSATFEQLDFKKKRSGGRKKRGVEDEGEGGQLRASDHVQGLDPGSVSSGGRWDTAPIESSIIESINEEPHPAYHLVGRTQVEPSPMINEEAMEEEDGDDEQYSAEREPLPMREGLVQVTLNGNSVNSETAKLRMVTLKSVKKVRKKEETSTNGVALVVPSAKRPTWVLPNRSKSTMPSYKMLELLIGDFLDRVPPIAQPRFLSREQWS